MRTLHRDIYDKLHSLRRRLRGRLITAGVAWLVIAVAAAVLATLAIDYALRLDRAQRVITMTAAAAALAYVAWRALAWPSLAPMRLEDLALLVERRSDNLGDRLISALQLARGAPGASPAMIDRVMDELNDRVGEMKIDGIIERRGIKRLGALACCCVMLLAGFSIWQGDVMLRYLQRNWMLMDVDWPQKTYLRVVGDDFTVVRGEELAVEVIVEPFSRRVPPYVTVHATYPSVGQTRERVEMQAGEQQRFVKVFEAVNEEFDFHVTGGDDSRDRRRGHKVRLVDPPVLTRVHFTIEHPPYMQRRPEPFDGSRGVMSASVAGTISFEGHSSKPLRLGVLAIDGKQPQVVPLRVDVDSHGVSRVVRGSFILPADNASASLTLRFELTDDTGITGRRGQQYMVQVIPDMAPSLDMRKSAVGASVTPNAIIPLAIRVKDEHGISAVRVIAAPGDGAAASSAVELPAVTRSEADLRHDFDLEAMNLSPGATVQLVAEAADTMPPGPPLNGPNTARSGAIDLRIIKPEELLADLVRRQKELRLEFMQAIALQETARGKTAEAAEALADSAMDEHVARRLSDSAALQSSVGAETAKAVQALTAILDEMVYNRVGNPAEHAALRDEIIAPLGQLGEPMRNATAGLSAAAAGSDAAAVREQALLLADVQRDLRVQMEEIARRMQKLESRQELANQLQVIVKWSEQILEEIRRAEEEAILRELDGK